jgi:hypothetical protein
LWVAPTCFVNHRVCAGDRSHDGAARVADREPIGAIKEVLFQLGTT